MLGFLQDVWHLFSFDVDGLDPSYCPGTPVPEIGGITPRDAQVIFRALQGMDIVGADIVLESGGSVEVIQFLEGKSSSSIIEKMERKKDE